VTNVGDPVGIIKVNLHFVRDSVPAHRYNKVFSKAPKTKVVVSNNDWHSLIKFGKLSPLNHEFTRWKLLVDRYCVDEQVPDASRLGIANCGYDVHPEFA
jgi:hypothetical protein